MQPEPSPASEAPEGPREESARWPEVDRRRADRRHRPTRFWDGLLHPKRRRTGRRREDHEGLYVDVYHRREVALVLAIFLLNVADAYFTLYILRRGGTQENPLMERLLAAGEDTFLYEKCFVVGFWLLLLLVHKNFRLARIGLWLLLASYSALFGYYVFLHIATSQ